MRDCRTPLTPEDAIRLGLRKRMPPSETQNRNQSKRVKALHQTDPAFHASSLAGLAKARERSRAKR